MSPHKSVIVLVDVSQPILCCHALTVRRPLEKLVVLVATSSQRLKGLMRCAQLIDINMRRARGRASLASSHMEAKGLKHLASNALRDVAQITRTCHLS